MGKGDFLGEFEMMVLFAALRLGDNAYGVPIWEEIEKRTGRGVALAAVYATLSRLEEKGHVSSFIGDSTPERGGRAKRYYTVEASGVNALRESTKALNNMAAGLILYWGAYEG